MSTREVGREEMIPFALSFSASGQIVTDPFPPEDSTWTKAAIAKVEKSLGCSAGELLLHLGFEPDPAKEPPSVKFFRGFAQRFVQALRVMEQIETIREKADPHFSSILAEEILADLPLMRGAEFVRAGVLFELWSDMASAFRRQISAWRGTVKEFFHEQNPAWRLVGRVFFNLAENKKNPDCPFAFLATYSTALGKTGIPRHVPLKQALEEYAGAKNREKLLELLQPIHDAVQKAGFLRSLVENRRIYFPLPWEPEEAYQFLREVPAYEEAGVICRVPDWWKTRTQSRVSVQAKVGETAKGRLGMDSLLSFSVEVAVDGQPITPEEWEAIRAKTEGLVLIRGQWVELNPEKLEMVLEHWRSVQKMVDRDGLSFFEGMRLLAGMPRQVSDSLPSAVSEWSQVVAGRTLHDALAAMRDPQFLQELTSGPEVKAELRPYQKVGVQWLGFMHRLGLGACLADDMGLGKTLQVLVLISALKKKAEAAGKRSNLLVVPASLIGNWEHEIMRFTPHLTYVIAHPSASGPEIDQSLLVGKDLVITSYGYLTRNTILKSFPWETVILDEAQAIKNSETKQTRSVKSLKSNRRLVLTGTPVENRLSDLWSIFDFLNPGLLGTAKEFGRFAKGLEDGEGGLKPLRNLVRPYILRRLKTDKQIIADLPEKTEMKTWCSLSKIQAVLYQESVQKLGEDLASAAPGIQRKGLIFAYLMRLKQICNHPSQWLKDGDYSPENSGKFGRLGEICREIAERGEKLLVFTQFREMTSPLQEHLTGIFNRPGLVLHGQTAIKERKGLVDQFQSDPSVPFFILSLKAGGTGLNLTAASHVIHFDRWWNPAVENQATDRAFRIGQKKNVVVHKFVCRGTVEEKIDALIMDKTGMAEEVLADSQEALLTTEMSDRDLLKFVSLDLGRAQSST
jgi:non-specific serine/threonine protein kinase